MTDLYVENLLKNINEGEKILIIKLIKVYSIYFIKKELTSTPAIHHEIVTCTIDTPVYSKIYRYPQVHEESKR